MWHRVAVACLVLWLGAGGTAVSAATANGYGGMLYFADHDCVPLPGTRVSDGFLEFFDSGPWDADLSASIESGPGRKWQNRTFSGALTVLNDTGTQVCTVSDLTIWVFAEVSLNFPDPTEHVAFLQALGSGSIIGPSSDRTVPLQINSREFSPPYPLWADRSDLAQTIDSFTLMPGERLTWNTTLEFVMTTDPLPLPPGVLLLGGALGGLGLMRTRLRR